MFACNKKQKHTAVFYLCVHEQVNQNCRSIKKREKRINIFGLKGHIEDTVKFGDIRAMLVYAEKMKDDRIKSGKYIKNDKMCH